MDRRRSLVGFLVLFLPALFFLLLKFFGKNHYELPIFLEKPLKASRWEDCPRTPNFPYHLFQDSLLKAKPNIKAYWVYLASPKRSKAHHDAICQNIDSLHHQAKTLINKSHLPHVFWMGVDSLNCKTKYMSFIPLIPEKVSEVLSCFFLIDYLFDAATIPESFVLVLDENGYIRGYFDPLASRDQQKALTELRILAEYGESRLEK
ncbi:MAG: hypothetical protein OXB93_00495 [Cytophagales bacterium]|nr:hypothetical protein [Cytophagales bacterium]